MNDLIRCAKETKFFSSIIESSRGDQRLLFQAVNNLLWRKAIVRYPSIGSDVAVAEKFKAFIIQTRYDLYAIVYLFTVLEFRMSFTWITLRLKPGPVNL